MMRSTIFKNKKPLILFLIPTFIFMTVYLYYPFLRNILNSFMEIDGLGRAAVGFADPWYSNYVRLVEDPKMKIAIVNSFLFMIFTIIIQVGIALVLAMLVDNIKFGNKFFRSVYFFPIVISATALGLLFNLIFLYDTGMINWVVKNVFGKEIVDWKDSAHWFFTMMMPVMWQYVGFYFVIMVTGLNNIPVDLFEAAEIDGASPLQVVLRIKLPLLYNVIITCITLAITGSLKIFDLPWTMFPNGMPLDESWLLGTYMYKQTFMANDVDYGSSIAFVIVILGVVISQITNRILKEKDY